MIYTIDFTENTFLNACKNGNINILLMLFNKNIDKYLKQHILYAGAKCACAGGYIQVLKLFFGVVKPVFYIELLICACKNGHLEMAKLLFEKTNNNFTLIYKNFVWSTDHVHILTWLFSLFADVTKKQIIENHLISLFIIGKLDSIKYFYEIYKTICPNQDLDILNKFTLGIKLAFRNGHTNCIKWFIDTFIVENPAHCKQIIILPENFGYDTNVECIELLYNAFNHSFTKAYCSDLLAKAIRNNNIDCCNYIVKISPECVHNIFDRDDFALCCRCNRLKMAMWMYNNIPKTRVYLCLLKKNNFMNSMFHMVCGRGYIKFAKWLLTISPEIEIDNKTFYAATYFKHEKILNLLYNINPFKFNINNQYLFKNKDDFYEKMNIVNFANTHYESEWKTQLYLYTFNSINTPLCADTVLSLVSVL